MVLIRPPRSRALSILLLLWMVAYGGFEAIGVVVLVSGNCGILPWMYFIAMFLFSFGCAAYAFMWNTRLHTLLSFSVDTLSIRSNTLLRDRWLPLKDISAFRLTRPWPYGKLDAEVELFRNVGSWRVEACSPRGRTILIRMLDRFSATVVADTLAQHGLLVELPQPLKLTSQCERRNFVDTHP